MPDTYNQAGRNLYLLRSAGIAAENEALELQVQPQDQARADKLLAQAGIGQGQPFLALAPGASAEARRYSEARFARAIEIFQRAARLPVVLLGGPRESGAFPILEAGAAGSRTAQGGRIVSFIGQTSVPEMAGVIRRAAVLVANNSGPMHIAAALNTPMVILYSGTETFEQWAPRTPNTVLLNRQTDCSPCHNFRCPYGLECLDIEPEAVAAQALVLLGATTPITPGVSAGTTRR
jgi:ADP-heptose:LPS heptosyltransferase